MIFFHKKGKRIAALGYKQIKQLATKLFFKIVLLHCSAPLLCPPLLPCSFCLALQSKAKGAGQERRAKQRAQTKVRFFICCFSPLFPSPKLLLRLPFGREAGRRAAPFQRSRRGKQATSFGLAYARSRGDPYTSPLLFLDFHLQRKCLLCTFPFPILPPSCSPLGSEAEVRRLKARGRELQIKRRLAPPEAGKRKEIALQKLNLCFASPEGNYFVGKAKGQG